jgi:hypothetical protein
MGLTVSKDSAVVAVHHAENEKITVGLRSRNWSKGGTKEEILPISDWSSNDLENIILLRCYWEDIVEVELVVFLLVVDNCLLLSWDSEFDGSFRIRIAQFDSLEKPSSWLDTPIHFDALLTHARVECCVDDR